MDIILFGPPGAGKGTQAAAACEAASVVHVSTGDIFRHHLKNGTRLGEKVRSYMDEGKLVPDELVVEVVASRLEKDDARGGVLFDGFPRTVNQARLLQQWLLDHGRNIDLVLNLVVPDEVVESRLSGRRSCLTCGASYHVDYKPPGPDDACTQCVAVVVQRSDDQPETVRKRIATYHSQTAPVLDWARGVVKVSDINANQAIKTVRSEVLAALQ
ncbi:MAG: adenylate kinase [Deltaproteobacteria bacterium]|nr:adenylate kinase [Deltaproteobacteria bacterium]